MILTKSFTYLNHINIYPITCLSCKSGNAVYVDSERSDSFLDRRGEALRGGEVKPEKEKCFQVIFVKRRFRPWWGLQTTSLFLLQQRLALSTFQWNKQRFLRSKSLSYLVVEEKVSSLKLVSTESVISLDLVQHPGPGKDKDWFELKKPNQVL